jgi:hypothetical protein
MAIVITDGKPTVPASVPPEVALDLAADIVLFAVGVTNNVDVNTLQLISSPPHQLGMNYFTAITYSEINTIFVQVLNETCLQNGNITGPPLPTTAPLPTTTPTPKTTPLTTLIPTTTPLTTTTTRTTTLATTAIAPDVFINCTGVPPMDLMLVLDGSASICDSDLLNSNCTNNWRLMTAFFRASSRGRHCCRPVRAPPGSDW